MSESRRTSRIIAVVAALSVLLAAFGYMLAGRNVRPPEWQGELVAPVQALNTVRYTANGAHLAAGSGTGDAVIWDLRIRDCVTLPRLTEQAIVSLEIASDGFLGATDAAGHLLGWQVGSEQKQTQQQLPAVASCLSFRDTPNGPELVLGLTDGTLVFLDAKGEPAVMRTKHTGGVRRAAYSPDGNSLVTGGTDGQIIWYDSNARKPLVSRSLHGSEIGALRFSTDGQRLASGDWNGLIIVWDVKTHQDIARQQQPDAVSGLAWVPGQPQRLLTGSWDGQLRFYSSDVSRLERAIDTLHPIYDLDLSHDGTTVAVVCGRNTIDLWRVP